MKRLVFLVIGIGASLSLSQCRTTTEPSNNIQPGMRAVIADTAWSADETHVIVQGNCMIVMGAKTPSGNSVSLSFSALAHAGDTLPGIGGNCVYQNEQHMGINGNIVLLGKTSTNVQGTFEFQTHTFRGLAPNVTKGEFNLKY